MSEHKVSDYDLSVRVLNALSRANVETLEQLVDVPLSEVWSWKNCGHSAINEMKRLLATEDMMFADVRANRRGTKPILDRDAYEAWKEKRFGGKPDDRT